MSSEDQTKPEAPEELAQEEQSSPEAEQVEPTEDAAEQGSGDPGAAEGEEPGEEEAVGEELAAAREEVLRAQAEVQNIRRRAEKDVENARRYALEKFSADLLPVVDNLERTLDASNQDVTLESLLEGVELTRKSFVDVLAKFQVEQIDPVGEPFDPQFHEAMSMVPNPDAEPNSVLHVVQKGYMLNGRVIRAAMVVVAASE